MKALVEPGGSAQGSGPALEVQGEPLFLQLTNGLSHESRNSLNALAIHLEVLADKLRDPTGAIPAHLDKNLQASKAQVRKLSEILERFSEFVAMRREGGDLAAAVENAKKLCSFQLRRADIAVHLDLPDGIRVDMDPPELQRMLVRAFLAVAAALPPCEIWITGSTEGREARLLLQGSEVGGGKPGPVGEPSAGGPNLQVLEGREACGCAAVGIADDPPKGGQRPLSFTARLLGALDPLRPSLQSAGGELRTKTGEARGCMLVLPLGRGREHPLESSSSIKASSRGAGSD